MTKIIAFQTTVDLADKSTWYVSGLPERVNGKESDWKWTKEISEAIDLDEHWRKRFRAHFRRMGGPRPNGLLEVQ